MTTSFAVTEDSISGIGISTGGGMSEPALRLTLGVDYLTSYIGRFSLMPVLAVVLAGRVGGASWATTGIGLFGFMLSAGPSSLLINRWLPKIPYRVSLPASLLLSAAGFGALPYLWHPVAAMVVLLLAGFGISVHAVVSRVLIAEVIHSSTGRNNIYAMQQIATNIAASVGPFIAAWLYGSGDARGLMGLVAVTYLLAAGAVFAGLPNRLSPPVTVRRQTRGLAAGLALMRDPECRRVTVVTALGAFVYAQFYSAFALLVALAIGSTLLRGALLAGPAIAIVVFQTLVTKGANRSLRSGVPPERILARALLTFGVAMLLLGLGMPVVAGAAAAMAVFACAEMLFTPMVSTAFNGLSSVPALAASNLQGVAWTAGEALGSLCGGAVFLICFAHGAAGPYWLVLAAVAISGAVGHLVTRRPVPERTVT
jgi:MFS family permease